MSTKIKHRQCIVAPATGPARGGLGVIRLSGEDALSTAKKFFKFRDKIKDVRSHQMYYGHFVDTNQSVVDDGYFVFFESPYSYTGEDTVELTVHGNPVTLNHMVDLICQNSSARLAEPGEFTQRAFLNDKMNLTQAEAVAEFIHASSVEASRYAQLRLQGGLAQQIEQLYILALEVLAECEADIDFPDENLPIEDKDHILKKLDNVIGSLQSLSTSYNATRKMHDGYKVAFLGQPNVGKSSLFNAILQEDRALVSDIAGTTRDRIHESLLIEGCPVQLMDTAGLRADTKDSIEQAGIQLSLKSLEQADLVCLLTDNPEFIEWDAIVQAQQQYNFKLWNVINKVDLKPDLQKLHAPKDNTFVLSAKSKQGLDEFMAALTLLIQNELSDEKVLLGNLRQKRLIDRSLESFLSAKKSWLRGQAEEFVALELREGMSALMTLLGKEDITEEILDTVFSKFCVGK
ncbi:MAG TPA: tRNA uridine-5-carboxymethylaminomethyl(34) synthesis GTPase MnmE [Oligoflexia bacterium]|nr:tRNA uridine-5-carboxymethylaminomethyl(34) synthesis GTPase MnmE [Oligoflexia bacterium]HMR25042.1 tRNA uridine-5-carboxymethylaminomethyl(34) synthesis GTPase MnmE [Oligoflexia bacterium]